MNQSYMMMNEEMSVATDTTVPVSNLSTTFTPYEHLWSVVFDLNMEVTSHDERIEKLEICCGRLIAFMCASIERTNALTKRNNTLNHHVSVLRKAVNHVDQMQVEIKQLQMQLVELKRARETDPVIHEAVLCEDHNI